MSIRHWFDKLVGRDELPTLTEEEAIANIRPDVSGTLEVKPMQPKEGKA